jgi:chaperone modulatory protein CbpM
MRQLYSEAEVVASVDGLTVTQLRAFVSARCVAPQDEGGQLGFAEADLARLRLLAELASDFELDEEAAALVLSLVDQIHGLRRQLRTIAEAIAEEPEDARARLRARLAGRR